MLFPFSHKPTFDPTMTMEHCLTDTTLTHSPGSKPQETSAAVATNATYYENVELQPPTATATGDDHMYEHVGLKPITTQQKKIEVAPNAAYGTVHR